MAFGVRGAAMSYGTWRVRVQRTLLMHVAITGATGLIGTALSEALRADGHRVTGITRSQPGVDQLPWSPSDQRIDAAGLRGIDAVVHLAGEPIAAGRWTAGVKRRIRDSRVEGTRLIARTLADLDDGPRTLVSVSGIDYYGDRGDELLTEASQAGNTFLADVCKVWEASAEPARQAGIRVVHPRLGITLTRRGGALPRLLPLFKLGLGGRFGSGQQFWSWIALEDVIGIFVHALTDGSVAGPLNATAPEPVTNATFTSVLGKVVGRPTLVPIPAFGPRLVFGEMVDPLIFHSKRVLPEATLASGYVFRHPQLETGLRSALRERAKAR
jgi:uncharacterized protein